MSKPARALPTSTWGTLSPPVSATTCSAKTASPASIFTTTSSAARAAIRSTDIALWDSAGKVYDAPIYPLLGDWAATIHYSVSTYRGNNNGGLDSPKSSAGFAE